MITPSDFKTSDNPLDILLGCDLYFTAAEFVLARGGGNLDENGACMLALDEDWMLCANGSKAAVMAEANGIQPTIVEKFAIVIWHMGLPCLELFPSGVAYARTSPEHDGNNFAAALERALTRSGSKH